MNKAQQNKIYTTIGASNHTSDDRQEQDYYATSPSCINDLLKFETFSNHVWEPAVGGGTFSECSC